MAVTDLDLLRSEIPQVFENRTLPPNWDEDLIFAPIPKPDALVQPTNASESLVVVDLLDLMEDALIQAAEYTGGDVSALLSTRGDAKMPIYLDQPEGCSFPGAQVVNYGDFLPPPDAWAFYLPFHYFHANWWGIYITVEGVNSFADIIDEHVNGVLTRQEAVGIARLFLYKHEVFHHQVETFALRLEQMHRGVFYKRGFEQFFQRTVGSNDCKEEALANAFSYESLRRSLFKDDSNKKEAMTHALREYIKKSPPGYSEAINYLKPSAFKNERAKFAEINFRECLPSFPECDPGVWNSFPHAFSGISRITSRVNYVIHKDSPLASRAGLSDRYVSYQKLTKKLKKLAGCKKVGSGKGSHEKWVNRQGAGFIIPRHPGDLKTGTLKAIIKQAGLPMSISEFVSHRA